MTHTAQITNAEQAGQFILGGNCRVTLVSEKTGARYTYKVTKAEGDSLLYFVSLLTGQDNESDYTYIGILTKGNPFNTATAWAARFKLTGKSKLPETAPPVAAFAYMAKSLFLTSTPAIPAQLQVWHEGRCARCNRALTVPESIKSGFGPECIKRAA